MEDNSEIIFLKGRKTMENLENNEVMEIMETEVGVENEAVLDTACETEAEDNDVQVAANGNDPKYEIGKMFVNGAMGFIGAMCAEIVVKEIVLPVAKCAVKKGREWVCGKIEKRKARKTAKTEVAIEETEAPKETKKKTEKK